MAIAICVVIILLCVGFVVFLLGDLKGRNQIVVGLDQEFSDFKSYLNTQQERVQLLDTHMTDYFNSVSAESHRALLDLRRLVELMMEVEKRLSESLREGNRQLLSEVNRVLEHDCSGEALDSPLLKGLPQESLTGWRTTLESGIQRIGKDLGEASIKWREAGLEKSRSRKETLLDLKRANIEGIPEQEEDTELEE